ncbi:MAG: TOBE domain-containing protein [Rhodospirillaceae bacterium]|nr:TOBE domain-containing protein [Rhodospirillaceae bacterium]
MTETTAPDTGLLEALAERRPRTGRSWADLLAQVGETGSITGAAKALGLSYRAVWEAINAANNLSRTPLVLTQPGGRHGGGAVVTPAGRNVIHACAVLDDEYARMRRRVLKSLGDDAALPLPSILWSLAMRTSARNAYRCTVTSVTEGPVNAEVLLTLSEHTSLAAIITARSVRELDLRPGSEVVALIKSTFILLARAEDLGRTSARNCISGTVIDMVGGAVSTEVVLDIGDGKTLAAVITEGSAKGLGIAVGDRLCALIKASHIILAVD